MVVRRPRQSRKVYEPIGGQVTVTVSNIDGTTTVRVPTAHLERVRAMLDHIAEDLPPMPEPEPEADPA